MTKAFPPITEIMEGMKYLEMPYLPNFIPQVVSLRKPEQQNETNFSHKKECNHVKQRDKFSLEEDVKLRYIVSLIGTKNWKLVAFHMKTKNVRQCRDRWKNYLSPSLNNSLWTPQEDEIIREKYAQFGPRWHIIGQFLNGRSPNAIRNRLKQLIKIPIPNDSSLSD